ncbi:unnamed protein product [Psylliodes chrysocephalus]|uniref:Uncharacterized protein n=1 Tax=Psylliodes chrysocephalus TaxID=3402493 RepID=A0A9P0DGC3_9CUCU|nr:unnamed protein product [Psylliodes chrysocephala]
MATLSINNRVIQTIIKKQKVCESGKIVEVDKRGKHNNHYQVDQAIKNEIREHIKSIPRIDSHYCRATTSKEYIEGSKTLSDLHRDYLKICEEKKSPAANYQMYRKIFEEEFNIAFHVPKKDQYELRLQFKNRTEEEKVSLIEKYESHIKEKDLSRKEKEHDINSGAEVIVFDLQAVLPCPVGDASSFFYVSKLNVLNFTLYDIKSHHGTCFLWHEAEAQRGANEIDIFDLKKLTSDLFLNIPKNVKLSETRKRGNNDEDQKIQPLGCPKCKTVIKKSARYSDYVKKHMIDLRNVKLNFYGKLREIEFIKHSLNEKLSKMYYGNGKKEFVRNTLRFNTRNRTNNRNDLTIENEDKNDNQFYSSVESSDDENSIANTDLEMDNQDTDIQGEKPDEDPALPHDLPTNKEPQDSNSNKKKSHSDEFVSEYVSIPSGSEYSGDENGPPVLKQTNITCTKELTLPDGRRQMKGVEYYLEPEEKTSSNSTFQFQRTKRSRVDEGDINKINVLQRGEDMDVKINTPPKISANLKRVLKQKVMATLQNPPIPLKNRYQILSDTSEVEKDESEIEKRKQDPRKERRNSRKYVTDTTKVTEKNTGHKSKNDLTCRQ